MKIAPKYILLGLTIITLATIVYFLSDIVTYILVAWVISMIGAPVMTYLRPYIGRNGAAVTTLGLFLLFSMGMIWFFVPPLVNQIQNLNKVNYAKVIKTFEEPIKDWEKWLVDNNLMIAKSEENSTELSSQDTPSTTLSSELVSLDTLVLKNNDKTNNLVLQVNITDAKATESIRTKAAEDKHFFTMLRTNIASYLNPQKIQAIVNDLLKGMGDLMVAIFSIFFISFFFLREQGLFVDMVKSLVPSVYESQTVTVIDETSHLLIRYFVGILFQVIIIASLVSLSLLILGVKNALLIGFFAGILNIIPYVGPLIAAGLGILITLSSHLEGSFYADLIPTLTKVGIVFLIVRIIDDALLQPMIFSKSVKAHPLEIFLVVMIGAKIGGVFGMLLAIPFYTAFRVFGKIFIGEFKIIQHLTKGI